MNVPLLRKIQRQIDKSPERFVMEIVSEVTNCGTAYCIAGWACALNGITHENRTPGFCRLTHAEILLDLTDAQSKALFWQHNWPERFRGRGRERLPATAIARIDHLIATGE